MQNVNKETAFTKVNSEADYWFKSVWEVCALYFQNNNLLFNYVYYFFLFSVPTVTEKHWRSVRCADGLHTVQHFAKGRIGEHIKWNVLEEYQRRIQINNLLC